MSSLARVAVFIVLAAPLLRAQTTESSWYVQIAAVRTTAEASQMEQSMKPQGITLQRYSQSTDRLIHLCVGPYSATQATSIRAHIAGLGYSAKLISASPSGGLSLAQPSSADLTSQQSDLEAQALAQLGGSSSTLTPANSADLEARALAKLGGATTPPVPSDPANLEAQAVQSMETQTAKNEIEAARRREQEKEQRRIEAERAAQEAQYSPPVSQPSGGGFLNGLNALLGAMNQGTQQGMAENAQIFGPAMKTVAQIATERAQAQAEAARRATEQAQQEEAQRNAPTNANAGGTGLCPNGQYVDDAAHCDCRKYSANAVYGCPSGYGSGQGSQRSSLSSSANGGNSGRTTYTYTGSNLPPMPAPAAVQPAPPPISDGCQIPYVGGPCLTPAQYEHWQTAMNNASTSVSPPTTDPTGPPKVSSIGNFIATGPNIYVCPRGGLISTGYYAANDAWLGMIIPCTPGQQLSIVWPGGGGSETITSASGGGSPTTGAGSGCVDVTRSIQMKSDLKTGLGSCGREVVAWLTNPTTLWAYCAVRFHKNGVWTDQGEGPLAPGKTQGGEYGGTWTCDADSSEVRYVCFAGNDGVDSNGKSCTANVRW